MATSPGPNGARCALLRGDRKRTLVRPGMRGMAGMRNMVSVPLGTPVQQKRRNRSRLSRDRALAVTSACRRSRSETGASYDSAADPG